MSVPPTVERPLHILHVTHNYPRWPGDVSGSFLLSLAREQRALGHQVSVLAPHAAGASGREELPPGVHVVRYRYGSDSQETLTYTGTMHERVLASWRARWRLLRLLFALRRAVRTALRERCIDIVHAHWWFPNALALWPWPGRPPLVVTSHGTDLFLLGGTPLLAPLARTALRRAAMVTTVSTALAARVRALGVPAERVDVIPMPLDAGAYGDPHAPHPDARPFDAEREAHHVLFVGRLTAQKGAADLVEAMAQVVRERSQVHLTVIGDGPERSALAERVERLGLEKHVRFLGVRTGAEVATFYRRASVLVVPSTTGARGEQEGFGLVAVEGMAGGVPVVATRSGGLTDIVRDGETGWLVTAGASEELARTLLDVLAHPDEARRRAGEARRDVVARFAPESLARRYIGVYHRALANGR